MTGDALFERTRKLLAGQSLCVLGTSAHGHPYTSLVVFAEMESLSKIVFFTRKDRTKYKNIKNDSRVSMYIDSREKWARDPSSIEGVTLLGVAWQIKPGDEFNELRDLYLKKNPHMTFFVNDPNSIMFRINVESYKYVVNFDESYDLKL